LPKTLPPNGVIHFGPFEANLRTQELRKHDIRLRVPGQSFQILRMLLERKGELVTREELRQALWPSDTYVDFDHGVNAAVNRLREALGDSADAPRFIETLPRRGYRFISSVQNGIPVSAPVMGDAPVGSAEPASVRPSRASHRSLIWLYGLGLAIALAFFLITAVLHQKRNGTLRSSQRALTRLTFDEGLQIGATWSPDGRYIAYAADRAGRFDIWIQQLTGSDPVQITKGPGNNWQPDWSPDGRYIAYRSDDGDGGVYVVPALGGTGLERKISSFGYYPKWSPDGSQILFQTAGFGFGLSCEFFIVGLDGNPPYQVQAGLTERIWTTSAAWHPDGKRISMWSWDMRPSPIPIFWTGPALGGTPIKTELSAEVLESAENIAGSGFSAWADQDSRFSWGRSGKDIYFERTFGGARNIWRIEVNPQTLQATSLGRLTTGAGFETDFSLSHDGSRMAFSSESRRVQGWMFPFDAKRGQLIGTGKAVTSPGMEAWTTSLSRDGRKLAFLAKRSGRWELWEADLQDERENPVAADDSYIRNEPQWSPDGSRLSYVRMKRSTGEVQAVIWSKNRGEEPVTGPSRGGIFVFDWSPDSQWLLAAVENAETGQSEIWTLPAAGVEAQGKARKIIPCDTKTNLWQSRFSPDGRWIVFEAEQSRPNRHSSAIFVTPATGGSWTLITDGKHWDDKPRWSPDGRIIYFLSDRKGFFNVRGIHFDRVNGKVVGESFQVTSFDNPKFMVADVMPEVGLSLTEDKLIVTTAQVSGSIWVLDNLDH
jgi:Tol biopolymer transport system component/DNA-binding winged helix-turn-helix (wHTH) protein